MENNFNPMPLFTVPVWRDRLPSFPIHKRRLIEAAEEYRDKNPGDTISNLNGYQSPKMLHSMPEFSHLFDYILKRVNQAAERIGLNGKLGISEAWVNFNDRRECMNFQHTHGGVLSGIFYLSAPAGSGRLHLVNPGINSMWEGISICAEQNQYTSQVFGVTPEEGLIVIWPSYLPHAVGTNAHDDVRISIAFNTTVIR